MYYVIASLYVLVCLCLLLVVLLQQGKGGDIASAFGGGSSQTAFGARGGATVLTKATAVLAVFFMAGALGLAIVGNRGPGTLMRGTAPPVSATPAAPATPPAATPATGTADAPAAAPSDPKAPEAETR
jgi:preprotein translocase subunit SecG